MKTTILFNDCLTFDQLQAYAINKSNKLETIQTYKHISTCELCACAVNGFTAIPFSFSDVDAIHNQIDVKTNATHTNPLTFARVTIVVISLASIFGFYLFANSFSENETKIISEQKSNLFLNSSPRINSTNFLNENKSENKVRSVKKIKEVLNKPFFKNSIPVESVKSINVQLPEPTINNKYDINTETVNADVIYIYNLKVTEYSRLYFYQKKNPFEMKGYTPSSKENKNASGDFIESDIVQTIAADRVLKKGLECFARGKYSKAIAEFNLLLDANSDDVNSLFYSAVSYYQIRKYNLAAKNLESLLENDNNVFYPEAKWNLALVNIEMGNKSIAKQLLQDISSEKGFYAMKAEAKLKTL